MVSDKSVNEISVGLAFLVGALGLVARTALDLITSMTNIALGHCRVAAN